MISTLSCSIVLYRQSQEVLRTIDCLQSSTADMELFVVDNSGKNRHGMADRIQWQCPGATIVIPKGSRNIGFGKGHNLIRRFLKSTYHLILSPSVTFSPEMLTEMIRFMDENTDVAILSPRIIDKTGNEIAFPKYQPSVRTLMGHAMSKFSRRMALWGSACTMAGQKIEFPTDVYCASGVCMMIRTHVFRDLLEDGFDKRFFMGLEDADLSRQVTELDSSFPNRIVFDPEFEITLNSTGEGAKGVIMHLHHLASAVKYFAKWHLVW